MRSDITSPNNGILSATLFERTILTMVTIKNNPRYTMISHLRPTARILRYIFRKSKLDLNSPLLCALCKRTAGKKTYITMVKLKTIKKKISDTIGTSLMSKEVKKFK